MEKCFPYQVRVDSGSQFRVRGEMGNILSAISALRDEGDAEIGEKFGIFLDFESTVLSFDIDSHESL